MASENNAALDYNCINMANTQAPELLTPPAATATRLESAGRAVMSAAAPVLMPFLVSRAVVLTCAILLEWLLDSGHARKYAYIGAAPLAPLTSTFDSNWYIDVAAHGYSTSPDITQPQNYHFCRSFPSLCAWVVQSRV